MLQVFTTIAGISCYLRNQQSGKQIGLVPTMGALHIGHLSLIERARSENELVIVSIFVNPLQFGPTEDFKTYPRNLEKDYQLCQQAGVDAIFAPPPTELYPQIEDQKNSPTPHSLITNVVPPTSMTSVLCGKYRPGHFEGVATIVTKLFNVIQPHKAYFGRKDAQQVAIIRRLVADLNLPVQIVPCPIIREVSGLAYSSRNQYLTAMQKNQAAALYRGLQQAEKVFKAGERHSSPIIAAVSQELALVTDLQIEYIELVHPTTLIALDKVETTGLLAIAAKLGSTRLIDNMTLPNRPPILAIDGPAGAGKSTVARQVAQVLGLLYLDTGAMYRALTWLVLQSGISVEDQPSVAELASKAEIQLGIAENSETPIRVWINDQEVTQAIRSLEVTSQVSAIAAQASVRQEMVKQQQRWGEKGGLVAEGRDIGTHVFPEAELKIFLTASVEERAKRRQQDLKNQGQGEISIEKLQQTIQERDEKDSNRSIAPLKKATDAIEIQTDNVSIDEVINLIVSLYNQKLYLPV